MSHEIDPNLAGHVGPKPVVRGKRAVVAAQHPIVAEEALRLLRSGGNAVDAGIVACLLNATVQQEMTNHAGTVTCLYYEARTGRVHQLESTGTLVPGLVPFRPILPPPGVTAVGAGACACIPGYMPGLQTLHERFGSMSWRDLCQPAIRWAEEGHLVNTFEYEALLDERPVLSYFESGRQHFFPDGFLPQVGTRFRPPHLADTLRRLSEEGPDYFTKGEWAGRFVAEGNRLGWPVTMEHMTAIPPRWQEPLRYRFREYEVVQLAPPEVIGVMCAYVLGVLDCLGAEALGHPSGSAEALYYMAHLLRRAATELALLQDPEVSRVPTSAWLSTEYHLKVADILRESRPKIDLTEHLRLAAGNVPLAAAGLPVPEKAKSGSCETSIVDADGNWLQIMNTLQTGGIPGVVIGGVPMFGSSIGPALTSPITGWFTGGGRVRMVIGHTMVLRDGKPWLALGTPGFPIYTVPQVLWSIIGLEIDPAEASALPRLWALLDDGSVQVESRIDPSVVAGLARLGVRVAPHLPHDWHMGSFQITWRDRETGRLSACVDARRAGEAGGL